MISSVRSKQTVFLCMVLAISLLLGCSFLGEKVAKKAVEKTTGVSVDKDGQKVKIKTKEGEAEIESGAKELPDGFPEDFPIYEDSTIKNGSKMTADDQTTYQVYLETEDEASEAADFYKESLPENGYEIENSFESNDTFTYTVKQSENATGTVTVGSQSGKTSIIITFTEK